MEGLWLEAERREWNLLRPSLSRLELRPDYTARVCRLATSHDTLCRLVSVLTWGTSCTLGMAASRTQLKCTQKTVLDLHWKELMLKEAAWTAKFIRRQREEEAEAGSTALDGAATAPA